MQSLYLRYVLLLMGMLAAASANAQVLNSRLYFIPGGAAASALDPWISGQQDVLFVVTNPGPDTVQASVEFEISYNRSTAVRLRREDPLPIPIGTLQIGRNTNFSNPIFDVFEGQPLGSYTYEEGLTEEQLLQIIATRALLAGEWEFCIRFYEPGTNVEIPSGACITLVMTDYQGPLPIYPVDDVQLSPNVPVGFQWSGVTPALGFRQHVRLSVWEILPGQDMVDAVRANMPVLDQEVMDVTRWFWSPSAIFLNPGDSMQYAWVVTPLQPEAILAQENGGASPPVSFWLKDPRPRIPAYVAPCDSIDIGPDLVREGPQAPPVRIGCPAKPGHTYEWVSDQGNYHAFQSYVNVQPQVTTRYVLFQTDPTGTCVVRDEVWIQVLGAFTVNLAVSPCGVIQPSLLTLPPSGTTVRTTVPGASGSGPARGDTALIVNGKACDANGNLIGGGPAPIDPCTQPVPPPSTTGPTSNATYVWSTGETTPTIHPATAGTYTCTVTDGQYSAVGSIDYTPSERFHGEFTELVYPIEVRQGDPQRALVIRQKGNEDGAQAAYNAMGYQVLINGPNGYQEKIKGSTTVGFADGEIRWDGGPDLSGVIATPGDYTATITLLNCSCPTPSDNRKYRLSHVKDATVPVDQAKGRSRDMTFEFKVKKARQSPQASDK
jgi:hypothetical protein